MTLRSELDNHILRCVQNPLPLVERPFEDLAEQVGCSQADLLPAIVRLKEEGFIRRYRGQLNYRALGRVAVLVTASVPEKDVEQVAAVVNALEGVSHNYLRKHPFNLWFTLQDLSYDHIEGQLDKLSKTTGMTFHALPAETLYKLDVRFNPAGPSAKDFECGEYQTVEDWGQVPQLPDALWRVMQLVQGELPIVPQPWKTSDLADLQLLSNNGILRRVAAVVNHYRLGYTVNVMLAAAVDDNQIDKAGQALASCAAVSHCYRRRTFPGWPYNLFAMIHAGRMHPIEVFAKAIAGEYSFREMVFLPTVQEFKKNPVFIR